MILGLYFFINEYRPYLKFNQSQIIVFLLYFIIAVCFFLFCGHGDLMPQDGDWSKHHAILYDLMNYDWPVIYDENAMLTYYIGQYIVPASIGKLLFHSKCVVNISALLWNSFGLTLVLCFLDRFFKLEKFYQKIILVFFVLLWGGAINLGAQFYNSGTTYGSFKWLDMGYIRVHFASNFDALRGAFQHVIVPWISCCILLINKDKIENYIILALPLLFSSTFGFLYYVMILFSLVVYKFLTDKDKWSLLRQMFSKQNLLLLPTTAILLIYFSGNFLSEKPDQFGFGLLNFFVSVKSIKFLLIFIIFEFGLYAVLVYKDMKGNSLFYIVVFELLIIPFITMGEWNDLCSRGGIPARFILMVMCIAVLKTKPKVSLAKIGIVFLLTCSALNVLVQSRSILSDAKDGWIEKSYIRNSYESYNGYAGNPNVRIDDAYNYYTLDYDESLFKKIAKK